MCQCFKSLSDLTDLCFKVTWQVSWCYIRIFTWNMVNQIAFCITVFSLNSFFSVARPVLRDNGVRLYLSECYKLWIGWGSFGCFWRSHYLKSEVIRTINVFVVLLNLNIMLAFEKSAHWFSSIFSCDLQIKLSSGFNKHSFIFIGAGVVGAFLLWLIIVQNLVEKFRVFDL